MTSVLSTFLKTCPDLSSEIKIRLILLYVALFDVTIASQDTVIDAAGLPQTDRAMIRKFVELGMCGQIETKSGLDIVACFICEYLMLTAKNEIAA